MPAGGPNQKCWCSYLVTQKHANNTIVSFGSSPEMIVLSFDAEMVICSGNRWKEEGFDVDTVGRG
jgi:hypothetical protein